MFVHRPLSFADIFPDISKHLSGNSQNIGKTSKSSVPVLSAGPLYFLLSPLLAALGFRISGQFLWSSVAPMLARCMAERGVVFRVAHRKSSRFSSRASRQITGVLHVTVWYRSTPRGGGRIRTSGEML